MSLAARLAHEFSLRPSSEMAVGARTHQRPNGAFQPVSI